MQRPHEALNLDTPIRYFQPSKRPFPEQLPDIEYRERDIVRKVDMIGKIGFKNHKFFISQALKGEYVALRGTPTESFDVVYCNQRISTVDIKNIGRIE